MRDTGAEKSVLRSVALSGDACVFLTTRVDRWAPPITRPSTRVLFVLVCLASGPSSMPPNFEKSVRTLVYLHEFLQRLRRTSLVWFWDLLRFGDSRDYLPSTLSLRVYTRRDGTASLKFFSRLEKTLGQPPSWYIRHNMKLDLGRSFPSRPHVVLGSSLSSSSLAAATP